MADLVLGVSKFLVEGALARVQSAIAEESELRNSARRDLVFITEEFQMMRCYLSTTRRDNVTNNIILASVAQLRDLSYEVEDGIEFVIHIDHTKSDWWLRVIPSFLAPARPLDEGVDIISQLKARIRDVRERITHYKIISDLDPKPVKEKKKPVKEKKKLSASHARDGDLEALTSLITSRTSNLEVISVWVPSGDLEATSTIRKAFDDQKQGWGNFRFRAWVKLAEPAFNSTHDGHEFVERLLQQLEGNNDQSLMMKYSYLVVLEDVTTKDVWDTIRMYFPDNQNGSRIIVITRQFQIATLCTGHPYIQRFWSDFSLCVLSKEDSLIGRVSEIEKLTKYLANPRHTNSQVISVWGMAGTGKSALVRNLYQKNVLENREFEKYGWVDVSHPFDLGGICQSLFLQFNSHSPQKDEDIFEECHSIMKHHRCLVVIDNLQSNEEWDAIKGSLAFRPSGSITIVITNDKRIAMHCSYLLFNVKALDYGAAFDLFKSKVARNLYCAGYGFDEKYQPLQQLISMCGGLPRVIVAVHEYLTQHFDWKTKAIQLGDQFMFNMEIRPEFKDLFLSIHNYFRSCPDYILYLLMFPKFQIIRRRRLLMRWIAEGYFMDTAYGKAEENGEMIFARIIELSMIQPQERTVSTDMRIVRWHVSAFFHEYIMTALKEYYISFPLEIVSLKECCRQTTWCTVRHLVIEESWERDKIVFETMDFSRLRSFTVFGKWESYFISESMEVLRVLDLENASGVTNKDLKTMLKLLPRLKFLSLRGCSEISHLPDSVCDLRQLQILDVRYTSIVAIPASITKLKKLHYLRMGTTTPQPAPPFKLSQFQRCLQLVGVKVRAGVGKLTTLHTLGVVNVDGAGGKDILYELRNLTQLCKIGLSGICLKNRKEFTSAILCLSHLQSLSVWLRENNENALCLCDMVPPRKLQSLKLYGAVKKLPTWIVQLNNIRKLNLELDILSEHDIEVLGQLTELCILRLLVKPNQGAILNFCVMRDGVEDYSYEKLKALEIATRSNLHLAIGSVAMRKLELLKVQSCSNGSELQFAGLKHLSKLKEVWVICSQVQALKHHLDDQFNDCPSKPVLKLEDVRDCVCRQDPCLAVQLPAQHPNSPSSEA